MQRLLAAGLVLLCACDTHMVRTTHPIKTPSEKMSVFPPPSALSVITNLAGPESVLHDPEQDVYFISNLNGGLLDIDGNGFISRVDPSTMQVNVRWIEGGKKGVKLDAPKGMAIAGADLYVSDVTAIRRFDRRTGEPRGEIALPGATLINDLTSDGTSVWASDTAVRPAPGSKFAATGTDAIWKITGGRAEKIASGVALNQPNGIDFHDGALWIVTFTGNELYRLDGDGKVQVRKLPRGQLDGLVHLQDGTPVVSSWLGTAIYRGSDDGFTPVLTAVTTPADIGYDAKRRRLLVPRSALNQVTIHTVQ
jgi:sugar lactone lactonase YvrE